MCRKPYALIIFDCDGVLVDSEPLSNRIFARALSRVGLDLTYADVCRRFIGLSMAQCVEQVERQLGRPLPPDFVEQLQAETYEAFRDRLQPTPGVVDALQKIRRPVCVASSGEPEKIRLSLSVTRLLPRFDGRLFSATEVALGKPAPDLFLHAARVLGADPARCAVVEDSLPGIRAGRAAGMVTYAYAPEEGGEQLRREGARVFREMAELPALLA